MDAPKKARDSIALTPAPLSNRHELLAPDWLEKWNRSAAKFPGEIEAHQHPSFEQLIRAHEQFRNSVLARESA